MNWQTIKERFQPMLISWCLVGLIYGSTRFIPGDHWLIPELWLDKQIPFSTSGIWFYLSFFLIVPFAFWRVPLERVKTMSTAIIISAVISGIFFVFFPSSLQYPQLMGSESLADKLFHLLLWIDTAQNCFPSLHAAITLISLLGLWQKQKTFANVFYLAVSLAIAYSIIQLRRHLTLDVTAGILLGAFAYAFAMTLHTRKQNIHVGGK